MLKISKVAVSRIIFCISIILFFIIQIFIYKFQINLKSNTEIDKEIMVYESEVLGFANNISENETIWQIEIPAINLVANIQNGTDKDTLNKYVGHFIETQIEEGNVGLAAHNRGYEVNYFARLKELKEGDEIIYEHNSFKTIYEVTKCKIITDEDWTVLENTETNTLTLITCVENEPNYRRCVQAEEKDFNYNY